jgi:hypothetical protein
VALAAVWTLPVALRVHNALPGPAIGDNAIFLWNVWWFRTALSSGVPFFHTDYLFAPVGTDLTLHTTTALPAFAGATLLRHASVTTALNITTLTSLALNGIAAYVLAWRMVRDRAAAVVAGVVFACSPFVAAHLNGHFNLVAAWTIPLFAAAYLEALRRRAVSAALVSGALLGATAYIDAYLLVYQCVLGILITAAETREWTVSRSQTAAPGAVLAIVALLVAVDLGGILAIWLTGGFSLRTGSLQLTVHDTFNPMQVLSVLAVMAVLAWRPLSVRSTPRGGRRLPIVALAGVIGVVIAAPLIWNVLRLIRSGDYVSQHYFWRSAPRGVDLFTVLLGNPFHPMWGAASREVYARLNIDAIESVGWPGVFPALLAMFAIRRCWTSRDVRLWTAVGAVFFVWSLGSHLFVAGHNTALVMPAALVQLMPILSNARMPGRAMVVVYLALAMLAAAAVAEYRNRRTSPFVVVTITALVAADFFIAPVPTAPMTCPAIYDVVRARPEQGVLVELPLGFGDGLVGVTPVDNRLMLACQTIHGHPIAGGFVARLSPRVTAAYAADPLLAAWMRLSGATGFNALPLPDAAAAAERMRVDRVVLVLVDTKAASEALQRYVNSLQLTKVADSGGRVLYAVPQYQALPDEVN